MVPLDDVRRWWRYHHLFGDLLGSTPAGQPRSCHRLHRAAAAWCEEHDLGDDAIRHALAAGDPDWAAQLIKRHLEEQILRRSEGATMARWLSALPVEVVRSRPRLCLGQAITALLSGRPDQAEPLIRAAEHAATKIDTVPYQPSVGKGASILANIPAVLALSHADLARLRGDYEAEARFGEEALARTTEEDPLLRSLPLRHGGLARRTACASRGHLNKVVEDRLASGERYLAVRACYGLGHVQQAQGRLAAALHTYQRALELTTEPARRGRADGRATRPFGNLSSSSRGSPGERAHLDRLLHAFDRHGLAVLPRIPPGGAVVPGLVAPLTARELEVLELLAAGQPNQVIAERLVITLDTVKRHVSHVLDKLGAANRTQAVARARELGLLR